MTRHDFAQLRDQFQQVIDQMPTQFTSHEFINVIAQQHQRLYIEALHTVILPHPSKRFIAS